MKRAEHIQRFLTVKLAESRAAEPGGAARRIHPFVTISRQAGAGGHALAETMVDVFDRLPDAEVFGGWQVFDQELCEIVADDPRLESSIDSLLSEEYRGRAEDFFHQLLRPTTDQRYLMERVFHTVRSLAGIGKVIILGRGGSEVTQGLGPGVRLRLVAPYEERIKRLMTRDNIDERQAREQARKRDAGRARLLKRHFGVDIDDPLAYDAIWNSAGPSLEAIAEAVGAVLRHRAERW